MGGQRLGALNLARTEHCSAVALSSFKVLDVSFYLALYNFGGSGTKLLSPISVLPVNSVAQCFTSLNLSALASAPAPDLEATLGSRLSGSLRTAGQCACPKPLLTAQSAQSPAACLHKEDLLCGQRMTEAGRTTQ